MAKVLPKVGPDLVKAIYLTLTRVDPLPPPTKDDWLRVSSLAEMCPREGVLAARHNITQERRIEHYDQLVWDHGKALHWALQNQVLPKLGVLVGSWQCRICGKVYGGNGKYMVRPEKCKKGCVKREDQQRDEPMFEYVEAWFKDYEYRVSGHPDGFLRLAEDAGVDGDGVLEGKSISDFGAKKQKIKDIPIFNHVIQLQAYLWLTGLKWGLILYWNKGQWKEPLVQHYIERDEDTIDSLKAMARNYWEGFDPEKPLPDRICSSADCNRAEKCNLVKLCFQEEK